MLLILDRRLVDVCRTDEASMPLDTSRMPDMCDPTSIKVDGSTILSDVREEAEATEPMELVDAALLRLRAELLRLRVFPA